MNKTKFSLFLAIAIFLVVMGIGTIAYGITTYRPVGGGLSVDPSGNLWVDIGSSSVALSNATLVTSTSSPVYVSLATQIAGEDQTNNRLDVAELFTYKFINVLTAQLLKTGPGLLHTITISNPSVTASTTVNVYDNTSGSGTQIAQIVVPASVSSYTATLDVAYSTGLDIQEAGATSTVTVSFY